MGPVSLNLVFALVISVTVAVWVVFVYWQVKLVKRIHFVSRSQYQIPENVFWLRRARMAIEADKVSQGLVRKRNTWAIVFLFTLGLLGILMAYVFFTIGTT